MPSTNETIYPKIKNNISLIELNEIYTPTIDDINFVNKSARGDNQILGYFIRLKDVPDNIIEHIIKNSFYKPLDIDYEKYDCSNTRNNHVAAIRKYLNTRPYDKEAIEASKIKDNDADIINIVIYKLLQQNYELPAFSTLVRLSRKSSHIVYGSYYKHVNENDINTGWNVLKELNGKPTISTLTQILEILIYIKAFNIKEKILLTIPDSK